MLPRDRQAYLYLELLNWGAKDNSLQKCVSQLPTCVLSHLNKPRANFVEYSAVSTSKCQVISSKTGAFLFCRVAENGIVSFSEKSSLQIAQLKNPTSMNLPSPVLSQQQEMLIIILLLIKNHSLNDIKKFRSHSNLVIFRN